MKFSLLVLGLAVSLNAAAQASDPVGDLIDRLNQEDAPKAAAAKPKAKPALVLDLNDEAPDSVKSARQKMLLDQAYASSQVRTLSRTASAAQTQLQPQTLKSCQVPPYTAIPFNEAEQIFYEAGFTGPKNGDHDTLPQVASVNFSKAVPTATHEMEVTVAVQIGSGWTVKDVNDTLAKTAKIYGQCGIRLRRATVILSHFPTGQSPITDETETRIAKAIPGGAPKPWLFFTAHRADNDSEDGSGTSIAFVSGTGSKKRQGSAWIARDSLTTAGKFNGYAKAPELVVGHELAHLLTNGSHQNETPNLLNGDGNKLTAEITPGECAQMRANSNFVHPL